MTTIYIVGSAVTGRINPLGNTTWTVETWGGGQSGNDSTGAGGTGGGYAKKNSFTVTTGTPVTFFLGAFCSVSAIVSIFIDQELKILDYTEARKKIGERQ